jgi:hypothetical protein
VGETCIDLRVIIKCGYFIQMVQYIVTFCALENTLPVAYRGGWFGG